MKSAYHLMSIDPMVRMDTITQIAMIDTSSADMATQRHPTCY